jgi:hypothetical protein
VYGGRIDSYIWFIHFKVVVVEHVAEVLVRYLQYRKNVTLIESESPTSKKEWVEKLGAEVKARERGVG